MLLKSLYYHHFYIFSTFNQQYFLIKGLKARFARLHTVPNLRRFIQIYFAKEHTRIYKNNCCR